MSRVPVVIINGIIPGKNTEVLLSANVGRVYAPKDVDLNAMTWRFVKIVEASAPQAAYVPVLGTAGDSSFGSAAAIVSASPSMIRSARSS